jgi:hypothetical protein
VDTLRTRPAPCRPCRLPVLFANGDREVALEELFREALGLYVRAYGIPIERAIAEEKTALDAIVHILLEAARLFPAGATPGGYLVSSGTLNCAPDHRSIADFVAADRERMVAALEHRITVGRQRVRSLGTLIRPHWPGMSRQLFRVCQYKRGTEPMRRPCWLSPKSHWLPGYRVREALSSAVRTDGLDERVDKGLIIDSSALAIDHDNPG